MKLKLMQEGILTKPYGIHILLGGMYLNTRRVFWLPCMIYSTMVVLNILFGIVSVSYTVVELWTDNLVLSLKQFNYVLLRLMTLGLVMTGLFQAQNMDKLFPILLRYQYTTPLNDEQRAVIAHYDQQFWKVFHYFKYLMFIVNTAWIAIIPLFELLTNEVINYNPNKINGTRKFGQYLPVLVWHPYDPDVFVSFLIQYILQLFFTFSLCQTAVGVTASYVDISTFLISSLKVLKISLQDIKQRAHYLYVSSMNGISNSSKSLDESITDDPIYHRYLYNCLMEDLDHHLLLRRIQRGMLLIYGPVLLFLLLIAGVFLCTKATTLLEINRLNDVNLYRNMFQMIQSVICFTSYIFVFCWYGEEITQASADVFEALHFCPWYDMPAKLKKTIYTMMICNLKKSQMSVAGLKTLNLRTFGESGTSQKAAVQKKATNIRITETYLLLPQILQTSSEHRLFIF